MICGVPRWKFDLAENILKHSLPLTKSRILCDIKVTWLHHISFQVSTISSNRAEGLQKIYEALNSSRLPTVWHVWSCNEITGLCFFKNENVAGQNYKIMIRYYEFLQPRNYPEDTIFQQNGASLHYVVALVQYLDQRLLIRSVD